MIITRLSCDESEKLREQNQFTAGKDEFVLIDNGGPGEWKDHFCWVALRLEHLEKFWPEFDYSRVFVLQTVKDGILHVLVQKSVEETEKYVRKVFDF